MIKNTIYSSGQVRPIASAEDYTLKGDEVMINGTIYRKSDLIVAIQSINPLATPDTVLLGVKKRDGVRNLPAVTVKFIEWSVDGITQTALGECLTNINAAIALETLSQEVLDFIARVEADGGTVLSPECIESPTTADFYYQAGAGGDGVAYSIKSGAIDDFLVIRASEKRVIGENGNLVIVPANFPAYDYPVIGGCPILLLEGQATNYIKFSEDFSDVNWAKNNILISPSTELDPQGNQNAFEITENGVLSSVLANATTAALAGEYNGSVWVKGFNGSLRLSDFASDSNSVTQVFTDTGEWQEIDVINPAITTLGSRLRLVIDSGQTGLIWGAQVKPEKSSYIYTNGATATRLKDVVYRAGDVNSFNSVEGVLHIEAAKFQDNETDIFGFISLSDGTRNNEILIFSNTPEKVHIFVKVGGVTQVSGVTLSLGESTDFRIMDLRWKQDNYSLWIGGDEKITDLIADTFPVGTLNNCNYSYGDGSNNAKANVLTSKVFKEYLSNDEMKYLGENGTLPEWSTYEEMALAFNYTIQ